VKISRRTNSAARSGPTPQSDATGRFNGGNGSLPETTGAKIAGSDGAGIAARYKRRIGI
jgi:hypothetical protein